MNYVYLIMALWSMCLHPFCKAKLPDDDALLWKISGKDINHPVYILGTHHQVCQTFLDSIPGLYNAFNQAEQFICESIPEEYAKYVSNSSYLPKDSTYDKLLPAKELDLFNEKIEYFLDDSENLKRVKPSVLILLIQGQISQKLFNETGIKPYNPICKDNYMDKYLMMLARKKELQLIALDEEADAFFNYRPIIEDLKKLNDILLMSDSILNSDLNKKKEVVESIIKDTREAERLYKTKELKKFENYLDRKKASFSSDEYFTDEFKFMGEDRNSKWMKKIPSLISNKSSFIAVGAAHLIGDSGLIIKLRELGYDVKPVKE